MIHTINWNGQPAEIDSEDRVAIFSDHGREIAMMLMPGVPCPIMIGISGEHPVWNWNGDKKEPTVSPSILTRLPWGEEGREVCNHVFIREGRIQYLGDCSHEYAGMTMDLPRLSEWPKDFILWDE